MFYFKCMDIILTSDEVCYMVLSITARESVLLANFTAHQYKLGFEVERI